MEMIKFNRVLVDLLFLATLAVSRKLTVKDLDETATCMSKQSGEVIFEI